MILRPRRCTRNTAHISTKSTLRFKLKSFKINCQGETTASTTQGDGAQDSVMQSPMLNYRASPLQFRRFDVTDGLASLVLRSDLSPKQEANKFPLGSISTLCFCDFRRDQGINVGERMIIICAEKLYINFYKSNDNGLQIEYNKKNQCLRCQT